MSEKHMKIDSDQSYVTYNDQLSDKGDMPKFRIIPTKSRAKHAKDSKVIIAPPIDYDEIMRQIPFGKLITNDLIKNQIANRYEADYTCPISSRKFIVLVGYASQERGIDITPYWRTLKKDGELNDKYPGGLERQKGLLEKEGHTIIQEDKKYYVKDYLKHLHNLDS